MNHSWQDVETAINNLTAKIKKRPDFIVGVIRGGIVPARLLAKMFDIEQVQCIGVFKSGSKRNITTDILLNLDGKKFWL